MGPEVPSSADGPEPHELRRIYEQNAGRSQRKREGRIVWCFMVSPFPNGGGTPDQILRYTAEKAARSGSKKNRYLTATEKWIEHP